MRKILTTVAVFATLTTSASAYQSNDFFEDLFGTPQESVVKQKGRHARQSDDGGSADWSASWGNHDHGGSRLVASYYGHGERLSKHTASGQVFNPNAMTAAHRSYPFGTVLRVCHRRCVNVTVNDRGPFVRGRSLDLSYGAARAIGMKSTSSITVERLN